MKTLIIIAILIFGLYVLFSFTQQRKEKQRNEEQGTLRRQEYERQQKKLKEEQQQNAEKDRLIEEQVQALALQFQSNCQVRSLAKSLSSLITSESSRAKSIPHAPGSKFLLQLKVGPDHIILNRESSFLEKFCYNTYGFSISNSYSEVRAIALSVAALIKEISGLQISSPDHCGYGYGIYSCRCYIDLIQDV